MIINKKMKNGSHSKAPHAQEAWGAFCSMQWLAYHQLNGLLGLGAGATKSCLVAVRTSDVVWGNEWTNWKFVFRNRVVWLGWTTGTTTFWLKNWENFRVGANCAGNVFVGNWWTGGLRWQGNMLKSLLSFSEDDAYILFKLLLEVWTPLWKRRITRNVHEISFIFWNGSVEGVVLQILIWKKGNWNPPRLIRSRASIE